MKLRNLTIQNVGPFVFANVKFEPEVTVLTGRNDTGKSTLLRIIQMICDPSENGAAGESDVNFDRLTGAAVKWEDDSSLTCSAVFDSRLNGKPVEHTLEMKLAPNLRIESSLVSSRGTRSVGKKIFSELPKVLLIRPSRDEGVRQQIYLNDLNSTERAFIGVAFGPEFSYQVLQNLSDLPFRASINRAEERLNRKLERLLPSTLPFRFRFQGAIDQKNTLFVTLVDGYGCTTPLGQRGTGVQRMIDLIGRLAVENIGNQPTILLLDEPETSLHAEAQHTLRRGLEELGKIPTIQVVYATHSPCMVNCMRPETIRVLKRHPHGESAKTLIEDRGFESNFASVRSSLGISPADSLLYAPITVIVSGKTEVLCLPQLVKRFEEEGVEGFAGAANLLSYSIFIESGGDPNLANLARIAQAQGSKVVIFCDGDMVRRVKSQIQQLTEIDAVFLQDNEEFEELIPAEKYLEFLSEFLEEPNITLHAFHTWLNENDLPQRMAFTKKLDRWMTAEFELRNFSKAEIMYRIASEIEIGHVNAQPIRELVEKMRNLSIIE